MKPKNHIRAGLLLPMLAVVLLSGCSASAPISPRDHKIALVPDPDRAGHLKALPPQCGEWDEDWLHPFTNGNAANFGCATAHNLALIVQNPADLEYPSEPSSSADAYVAAGALDRYRKGAVKEPTPMAIETE